MKNKKAFTLMEIVIVVVIVGVLAAIAVPNLSVMIERSRLQDAQNMLLTIRAAQMSATSYQAGANETALNTNLDTDIPIGTGVSYRCAVAGGPPPTSFTCIATRAGGFTMEITEAQVNLAGAFNAAGRNPRCTANCP